MPHGPTNKAMSEQPPPMFYRVQHASSFTNNEAGGFAAKGRYCMADCHHWVNKEIFESHLDWEATPVEATPYISLFDKLADAQNFANLLIGRGFGGVLIARIKPPTPSLELTSWSIHLADQAVELPVWRSSKGCTFISTAAIRRNLGVEVSVSRESEWFAVEEVPSNMVTVIWKQPVW